MQAAPADALMPSAVMIVAKAKTWSSEQLVTTHTPYLKVEVATSGDTLTLDVSLLSAVGTSTKAGDFHSFVSFDGQPIVLALPPFGHIALTFPGLTEGTHYVRYGVYAGSKVLEDQRLCPSIVLGKL